MKGCDKYSGSNPNRLLNIIMFFLITVFIQVIILCKNPDQIRSFFEKGFLFISSKRLEVFQPVFRCAPVIEFMFFFFSFYTDLLLYFWVTDSYKMPGLLISAIGSSTGSKKAVFNDLFRNRSFRKIPYCSPAFYI